MFSDNLEERLKKIEQDLAWMQRDMVNLINIVEALKIPEVHTHYTMITENVTCSACMDDVNNTNNLEELT